MNLAPTTSVDSDEGTFDLLRWLKLNSERFPILSSLARDVLDIPIYTIAFESAFSTGGRVLDSFQRCLTPQLVEALICTQDWLKKPHHKYILIEESLEELEDFEKGILFNFVVFSYYV